MVLEKGYCKKDPVTIVFDDDNDGKNEHYGSFDQRKRVQIKEKDVPSCQILVVIVNEQKREDKRVQRLFFSFLFFHPHASSLASKCDVGALKQTPSCSKGEDK